MCRTLSILVLALAPLAAQDFNYTDFSVTGGLALVPNALQSGNVLRVNSSIISDKGAAWYSNPVPVATGFDTTFTFRAGAA